MTESRSWISMYYLCWSNVKCSLPSDNT